MTKIKTTITQIIKRALKEDFAHNDVTTKNLVNKNQVSEAYIISKQEGIICGNDIVKEIFHKYDPSIKVHCYHKDGQSIKKNEPVIFIFGSTRSLLSCERVALNFLGHLSGIASLTAQFVKKVSETKVKILDTRKTAPGFRDLEKYAVRCAGGENHRRDLNDMILIKDNHLLAKDSADTFTQIIKSLRRKTKKKIELEVDTIEQFQEALIAQPDIILLDNMSIQQLKHAVRLRKKAGSKILLEASGGVNLQTVVAISKTGIDRISVGQLTHSANSLNFSMEFVK